MSAENGPLRSIDVPDYLPSVSFSIDIGRQFEHIDFDYKTYSDYLKGEGLGDREVCQTSIEFGLSGPINYLRDKHTVQYDQGADSINVKLAKPSGEDALNNYLLYSVQRKIDYDLGSYQFGPLSMHAITDHISTVKEAAILGLVASNTLLASEAAGHPRVNYALGALALVTTFASKFNEIGNPAEMNARDKVIRDRKKFVHFTPRTKSK